MIKWVLIYLFLGALIEYMKPAQSLADIPPNIVLNPLKYFLSLIVILFPMFSLHVNILFDLTDNTIRCTFLFLQNFIEFCRILW